MAVNGATHSRDKRRVGALLAAVHLAFWLLLIIATPPVPTSYFSDRPPDVIETPHGIQFHLRSHVEPLVVLAERPFGKHHWEDGPLIAAAITLNLPGALSAALTADWLEAGFGRLGASWAGTAAFFAASSAQWWVLGWCASALAMRRARHRDGLGSAHP